MNVTELAESNPPKTRAVEPVLFDASTQVALCGTIVATIVLMSIGFVDFSASDQRTAKLQTEFATELRLDINAATLQEWMLMPGIGRKTAIAILDDRQSNGPFSSLADLQRVRGIGKKTVSEIQPYCMPVAADAFERVSINLLLTQKKEDAAIDRDALSQMSAFRSNH